MLGLALVACGDGAADDGTSFAPGLCEASIRWRDDLAERAEQLSRAGVGVEDRQERTALLVDYLEDAGGISAAFVAAQAEAAPSTEVAGRLRAAGEEIDALLEGAQEEVVARGQEDEPFVGRGIQVVNRVEKTASVWKAAVADLRADRAFDEAFLATEACRVIPRTADEA